MRMNGNGSGRSGGMPTAIKSSWTDSISRRGRRRPRSLGHFEHRAPLSLRRVRSRSQSRHHRYASCRAHQASESRSAGLYHERPEPTPRGRGDRSYRPPYERSELRWILSWLPVAVDERPRTASRHRATLSPEGFTEERLAGMSAAQLAQERENDRLNRDVFEEQVDLVLDAWTQDSLNYRSNRWELPYPYDEGIEWGMASVTKHLGAPGEIGANGRVRAICVCPTPYTQPHPTVFVASNASVETVEYCGGKGFIPTYFSSIGRAAKFGQAYVEHARAAGHNFALGQTRHSCVGSSSEKPTKQRGRQCKTTTSRSTRICTSLSPLPCRSGLMTQCRVFSIVASSRGHT